MKAATLKVLGRQHTPLIQTHLLALDANDRANRFMGAVSDDHLARYALSINFEKDLLVGVMRGKKLVGLAHAAVYMESGETMMEVGLSVLGGARRSGLGKRLLQAALEQAAHVHARRVFVMFRSTNAGMAALATSVGGRIGGQGSEMFADFEIQHSNTRTKSIKTSPMAPPRPGAETAGPARASGPL